MIVLSIRIDLRFRLYVVLFFSWFMFCFVACEFRIFSNTQHSFVGCFFCSRIGRSFVFCHIISIERVCLHSLGVFGHNFSRWLFLCFYFHLLFLTNSVPFFRSLSLPKTLMAFLQLSSSEIIGKTRFVYCANALFEFEAARFLAKAKLFAFMAAQTRNVEVKRCKSLHAFCRFSTRFSPCRALRTMLSKWHLYFRNRMCNVSDKSFLITLRKYVHTTQAHFFTSLSFLSIFIVVHISF